MSGADAPRGDEQPRAHHSIGAGGGCLYSPNFDLGSAGLIAADLDGDGDTDLVLPTGDNLEEEHAYPQPYHGCLWLENRGDWEFAVHRVAEFGGAYAAAVGDLNGDGHRDIVLVSMVNEWENPRHASIVWLENDGRQNFHIWQIDKSPTHLVTVACGDVNGDGRDDIVAGGLHLLGPYDRLGSITGVVQSRRGGRQMIFVCGILAIVVVLEVPWAGGRCRARCLRRFRIPT